MDDCLLEMRPADAHYQNIVTEITKKFGLPYIKVVASKSNSACATYLNNCLPVIAYNPEFLLPIKNRSYRAVETTFAHEIGHHYYGHMKIQNGNFLQSHANELEADYFAGFAMRYRSASLADTLLLLEHPAFVETATHPGREKRMISMENGWIEANEHIHKVTLQRQSAFANFLTGATIFTSLALIAWGLSSLAKED